MAGLKAVIGRSGSDSSISHSTGSTGIHCSSRAFRCLGSSDVFWQPGRLLPDLVRTSRTVAKATRKIRRSERAVRNEERCCQASST